MQRFRPQFISYSYILLLLLLETYYTNSYWIQKYNIDEQISNIYELNGKSNFLKMLYSV